MSATVTGRRPLAAPMVAYGERKLQRLDRHANIHDVTLLIDHDENRIPACRAEVIIHIHHTRLAVKAEGATIQAAIDVVVDKADRQVLRRKERAGDHRGRENGRLRPPPDA